MSSLASPVLLGSQWVNPCLRSPMHEWATRAAKLENWPSQLTKDWLSSIRLHWGTLCFIPGNGAHVCWIEEKYMVVHIYGITLNTAKSADQYYSSYAYQSSSLISYFIDLRTAQVYCFAILFTCWHPSHITIYWPARAQVYCVAIFLTYWHPSHITISFLL